MLLRWFSLLDYAHALTLVLLPLYLLYSAPTAITLSACLLYLLYAAAVPARRWLQRKLPAISTIRGFVWLEQMLTLALLLTLLWLLYLPQAPYTTPALQLLWLNCQLALTAFFITLTMVLRQPPASTQTTATAAPASRWLIAYASQSGAAMQLAQHSAGVLRQAGLATTVAELNQITPQQLTQFSQALFVVSTYGEGEPPDNASHFYRQSANWQTSLHRLRYAVLALGDKRYQQFCAFGHWLHNWLQHNTASALQPVLELDSTEAEPAALQQWQTLLQQVSGQAEVATAVAPWQHAVLHSRYIANPASSGLPCYVVKLQLPANSQWQAGDLIEIQPENSRCAVALWLTRQQINGCQAVQFGQQTMPLCWALAQLQLDQLSPPQQEPLEQWLARQPRLPLRRYSIASIADEGPLMLLVRQVTKADGSLGLGSGWLTHWACEQQRIKIRLCQHSQFHLPEQNIPLILIANGTGIAAMRALLAQRIKQGQRQNWLLFGERQAQSDAFFARDLQHWQQQGGLSHLDLAYSRDQAEKRYVQHLLAEQMPRLRDWLAQGAAIYVCGSLQGMGEQVHQLLQHHLGPAMLQQLIAEGRYRRDLY